MHDLRRIRYMNRRRSTKHDRPRGRWSAKRDRPRRRRSTKRHDYLVGQRELDHYRVLYRRYMRLRDEEKQARRKAEDRVAVLLRLLRRWRRRFREVVNRSVT